ncbi:LysM peptidoglycan-binding domain-containing protein [Roseivirga sp.]|uniref:LysM peptidoglycan-binding domain-containing protein n=1 Tax=Roseivirga sp. TaxID=1964215 RepID=UPI003B51586B
MRRFSYIVILLVGILGAAFAQTDSLGIERQGDKVFVIHKVKAQQTLYSLSRRYKTTVSEINAANPILANGLQIGQTLKIPYGGEVLSPDAEITSETRELTHKVKAGETLFSIARRYEVQVSDIKTWNSLSSNAIDLGQNLVIKQKVMVAVDKPQEDQTIATTEIDRPKTIEVPDSLKVSDVPFNNGSDIMAEGEEELEEVSYPGTPFQQIQVEGVAEVIEEKQPSSKFFALHRTAKEGTVIKVKNLMNDLTVYVRVIGTIPETSENENVIIKLNQRAYDHLKAIDKRFRVQLNYFQ